MVNIISYYWNSSRRFKFFVFYVTKTILLILFISWWFFLRNYKIKINKTVMWDLKIFQKGKSKWAFIPHHETWHIFEICEPRSHGMRYEKICVVLNHNMRTCADEIFKLHIFNFLGNRVRYVFQILSNLEKTCMNINAVERWRKIWGMDSHEWKDFCFQPHWR